MSSPPSYEELLLQLNSMQALLGKDGRKHLVSRLRFVCTNAYQYTKSDTLFGGSTARSNVFVVNSLFVRF